jgi:hypothetical protein
MRVAVGLACANMLAGASAHAGLFIPTARNANDRFLPEFVRLQCLSAVWLE